MKILFPIVIFYPATVGGPSSTLYWHTCYLKSKNIDTYIVATNLKIENRHDIEFNKWINTKAGKTIYCKTRHHYFPIRTIWETVKKILTVDVVHYSSAFSVLTVYTIFLSILLRKRIFLSPRGELFQNAIDNPLKRMVINLYRMIHSKIVFHATSLDEYNSIKKLFPKSKIIIQPNFISTNTSVKEVIKSRNIIFLGLICPVKKIENLIQAVSLSECFRKSNSLLLIAGFPLVPRDFAYHEMLISLISNLGFEDRIKFVGEIFDKEKEKFLNDAYMLVLPSESENFGNVVTEALSQSTPVIASTGTPWHILKDKNVGWWVENNPESLKKAIDEALSLSEAEYLIKCKESLKLVTQKYNISTSLDNHWLNIYESAMSQ